MARTLAGTPQSDGFRMPAEWEQHAQTWLLWPQRPDNWRRGGKPAQRAFAQVAAAIAGFEPVTVGVNHDQYENARAVLPPEVRVVEISSNDAWMRDCGPTFVVDDAGGVRVVDWRFNAWGGLHDGLYFPWDRDDLIARKVAEMERVDRYRAPIVLEGGSIHVDGEGTLLTTEECLLSRGRNPELTKEQIEEQLCRYTGCRKVIWLNRGIDPEETNGHVDVIACFVRPGVVAVACCDDLTDWRREVLAENEEILRRATDARGRRLEVHRIPVPDLMYVREDEAGEVDSAEGTIPRLPGDELAASYINYYVCNGGVIVPAYGQDAADREAARLLAELYPDREVVLLPVGREIELGGGNVHCITQQQPAAGTK